MKSSSEKMQKNPKRRGIAGSGRLQKKKVDCFFTTDDSAIFFLKNMNLYRNKEQTMKKLRAMYKGYMLHPILYKTVTRTSIVAVLMLLWERYVSDGTFSMWEAPGFLCGVVLLIWAWVDYMRLDGLTIHHLLEEFKGIKPQKKFHATRSIMDYADEKIVSFEELEPEERTYCSMLSNLVLGVPLVVVALCISFL